MDTVHWTAPGQLKTGNVALGLQTSAQFTPGLVLLFFQGNTWAICMKTNILLIVPRSSCRVWTYKATIISLVLTILVAIAVLRYFSLIENISFSSLAILGTESEAGLVHVAT